jgi:hypothetical protein
MTRKNQAIQVRLSFLNTLNLATLGLILTLTAATSQTMAQALTRPRATQLIYNSKEFRDPVVIVITDDEISVDPVSRNETEEEARVRALDSYYMYTGKWSWAALKYLSYIDAKATLLERPHVTDKGKPWARLHPWKFRVEHFLTEKGKEEARKFGLAVGKAIPLAHKKVITITGITTPRRGFALAEFNWSAVPTAAGEAFNPTSSAFKSLPESLQAELRKPKGFGIFSRATTEEWGQIRKSIASFQLYDDGWRLHLIR